MGNAFGKLITWVIVGLAFVAIVAGITFLKQQSDDAKAELPPTQTVIDEESGITWAMHGKPKQTAGTSTIGKGTGPGSEIDVRTYTVDHGDWVERVKIYDVPPSEIDFAPAMLSTFGADPTGKVGKVDYVQVDGFNAASALAPGQLSADGRKEAVSARVFATQMHNYMVSGGVAVRRDQGSGDIDLDAQETQLRDSMHEA
ncbi:MAG: hypothetical protein U0P45_06285 [Acidimicrobiales bacterium]